MKILQVTAQKPGLTGSGTYLKEIMLDLERRGVEQALLAGVDQKDDFDFPGIAFFPLRFKTNDLPFSVVGMSDNMPYPATRYNELDPKMQKQFDRAFRQKLKEAVSKFKPDLIICHHLYFLTAIAREELPKEQIFGICHGTCLRQIAKTKLQNDFIKEQIAKLDQILALHQVQAEQIKKIFPIKERGQVKEIGTGYNEEVFYWQEDSKEKNKPKKQVIYAGKLARAKGLYSLIRALNLVDVDLELVLAGSYSDEAEYLELKRLADLANYPVSFLGRLDQTDLARYFNQADLFVLPSFYEGLPLVVIEALATGLPVVSTNLPGLKDYLDRFVKDHGVSLVKLPRLYDQDQPFEADLAGFEAELALAIQKSLVADWKRQEPKINSTWKQVVQRILDLHIPKLNP